MHLRFPVNFLLVALFAVPAAWGDTATMHCNNYTVTVTSNGPAGSIELGNNGCGIIAWNDPSNQVSLTNPGDSLIITRNYDISFVADSGSAFTTLQGFLSTTMGNGQNADFNIGEYMSLFDLHGNLLSAFDPCATYHGGGHVTLPSGCNQAAAGFYDTSNGNECCAIFKYLSPNLFFNTGDVPLPENGFDVHLTAIDAGHVSPDGGEVEFNINLFQFDLAALGPAPPSSPSVPEPSSLVLLSSGLLLAARKAGAAIKR